MDSPVEPGSEPRRPDVELTEEVWLQLAKEAWAARKVAFIYGRTRVGCALLTGDGRTFSGCNVEHRFRSHDIHAEVNAISSMVAAGQRDVRAILIAARRVRFTPCGSCMDWIFQFGGPSCLVAYQGSPGSGITVLTAGELMPHYPT